MPFAVDFDQPELTPAFRKKLLPVVSNWKTVFAYVATLPENEASLRTLANMLTLELQNPEGARYHILDRLHGKFIRMRGRIESATLLKRAKRN